MTYGSNEHPRGGDGDCHPNGFWPRTLIDMVGFRVGDSPAPYSGPRREGCCRMRAQYNNPLESLDLESPELKAACDHIVNELRGGVGHGFFKMNVKVETVQGKRKQVTIESGKSYRFTV